MQKRPISFEIVKQSTTSGARAGVVRTPHGDVQTPAFVSVGTKATVKGIPTEMLWELGVQILIANGYHLYLSGMDAIAKSGGVGNFMGWSGPTMTDSGGFQVFSLGVGFGKKISKFAPDSQGPTFAQGSQGRTLKNPVLFDEDLATSHGKLAIVDDDGVTFTSHTDGSLHRFTPERSIEIQHALGADIIFAFDECTAPNADRDYQKEAMDRTHRWAKRSLAAHRQDVAANARQGIYGIVQGGRYEDLRVESAQELARMDFDGYGIGGSFSKEDLLGILDKVTTELPQEKPRHLLGIGEPEDMFIGAAAGMDTFDCVLPTRNGRTGTVYTAAGKINIENAKFASDFGPIDAECTCFVCAKHTRSYINHLFKNKETLALILASAHNMHFLVGIAERIRQSILDENFEAFRDDFLATYYASKAV
jgi:queuine tRNA-ribosyltransferase